MLHADFLIHDYIDFRLKMREVEKEGYIYIITQLSEIFKMNKNGKYYWDVEKRRRDEEMKMKGLLVSRIKRKGTE